MIHGIYIKSRPKAKWHLVSVAVSAEGALHDQVEMLKQSKLEGNDCAEAAIQLFDSEFHVPEFLNTIKEQKLLFN